jgi:pimeloyl-ACP methyl ester carboxylesterase
MLASGRAMAPLAQALGVEARMPDLPGHGRAGAWPEGRQGYLDACLEAIGPLPQGVDLVGHSFGAVAGLAAALGSPGRVRSLTMIEPVLFAAMEPGAFARYAAAAAPFAAAFGAGDRAAAAAEFHASWGEGHWPALPDAIRDAIVARIHLIPAAGPTLVDDAARLLPRLADAPFPILHVCRGDPPEVTAAIRDGLLARRPGIALAEVPGARHLLAQTHPAQLARAIAAFWSGMG